MISRPCRSESCQIEAEHEEHSAKEGGRKKASTSSHHGELSPEFRAHLEKRWGRALPADGSPRPAVPGWEWFKYPASRTWRLRKIRG